LDHVLIIKLTMFIHYFYCKIGVNGKVKMDKR